MRVQVPLVVELDDDQVQAYAEQFGLPVRPDGTVAAKVIVDDVQRYVLTSMQGAPAFTETGATVSIKGR